jgi:DNA repair protein RadA/Sms
MANAKNKNDFACTECGWSTIKWAGRCGECQSWGTVQPIGAATGVAAKRVSPASIAPSSAAKPITEVSTIQASSQSTGVGEFDRVLGGGLVAGAVVLLSGEPGVGKSTLLLSVAAKAAATVSSPRRATSVIGFSSCCETSP